MEKEPTCKDIDFGDGSVLSDHDWIETYNDGKTQVLKCQKCGVESTGWTDRATTDVV